MAYEIYDDADMGISSIGHQDALQQRVALHADWHLSNRWRVFAELGDGLATDRQGGNKTADETDPDIWQLFLDRRWQLDNGDRFVLRVGRQLIETGNLFINAGEGNNVRQTYNGVRAALVEKDFEVPSLSPRGVTRIQKGYVPFEIFAAEYVDFGDGAFDMEGTDEYFWGLRLGTYVPKYRARINFLYT
ncbi:MAG: alginate export family protein, partial [Gammaproteobacteria bacterium]|nr:alginate export family protein [Gammaproteobacteria bacterium]